jgi:hypothetical protein
MMSFENLEWPSWLIKAMWYRDSTAIGAGEKVEKRWEEKTSTPAKNTPKAPKDQQ